MSRDELEAKVARAFGTALTGGFPCYAARAAIAIVVEACAEIAVEHAEEWSNGRETAISDREELASDAAATACAQIAQSIRNITQAPSELASGGQG